MLNFHVIVLLHVCGNSSGIIKQQQIRSARGRGITTLKKPRFKDKREAEKEKQKR